MVQMKVTQMMMTIMNLYLARWTLMSLWPMRPTRWRSIRRRILVLWTAPPIAERGGASLVVAATGKGRKEERHSGEHSCQELPPQLPSPGAKDSIWKDGMYFWVRGLLWFPVWLFIAVVSYSGKEEWVLELQIEHLSQANFTRQGSVPLVNHQVLWVLTIVS